MPSPQHPRTVASSCNVATPGHNNEAPLHLRRLNFSNHFQHSLVRSSVSAHLLTLAEHATMLSYCASDIPYTTELVSCTKPFTSSDIELPRLLGRNQIVTAL